MRVALLHAPPWPFREGSPSPPPVARALAADADFLSTPLGLLSLTTLADKRGHDVVLLNLANRSLDELERVTAELDAELFGISCFTANRWGVRALAHAIRSSHPESTIVLGGPFATVFPDEILRRWRSVDGVVVGEGEETFIELLDVLDKGAAPAGLAGTLWRADDALVRGPARPRIRDLHRLPSPTEPFSTHLLVTARGCFGRCTFCASEALWSHRIVTCSSETVLQHLVNLTAQGRETVAIKDEVFTANRRRVLSICQGIVERRLPLRWSCDTRVDRVDAATFEAMRRAGCRQVSFGVESGSPAILEVLGKKTTPDQTLHATRLAREQGLEVRWFLMWGNPGETPATIAETLELIERGQPDSYALIPLAVSPGSKIHARYCRERGLARDFFFDGDFIARSYVDKRSTAYSELIESLGDARGFHQLRTPAGGAFTVEPTTTQPLFPGPLRPSLNR